MLTVSDDIEGRNPAEGPLFPFMRSILGLTLSWRVAQGRTMLLGIFSPLNIQ